MAHEYHLTRKPVVDKKGKVIVGSDGSPMIRRDDALTMLSLARSFNFVKYGVSRADMIDLYKKAEQAWHDESPVIKLTDRQTELLVRAFSNPTEYFSQQVLSLFETQELIEDFLNGAPQVFQHDAGATEEVPASYA